MLFVGSRRRDLPVHSVFKIAKYLPRLIPIRWTWRRQRGFVERKWQPLGGTEVAWEGRLLTEDDFERLLGRELPELPKEVFNGGKTTAP
jgi:hypothetical protein